MQLSGQEYVDVYAAKVKAGQGSVAFGARPAGDARAAADRLPAERAS